MIICIFPKQKHLFYSLMKKVHQQRFQVFCKELNWQLPLAQQPLESDEFDHHLAHYIIYSKSHPNNVCGGIRLSPLTAPVMIRNIFSHLIEDKRVLKSSNKTWELTRLYLMQNIRGNKISPSLKVNKPFAEICLACLEFGLTNNIASYIAVITPQIAKMFVSLGWNFTKLGKNIQDKDGATEIFAISLEVSFELTNSIRMLLGVKQPLLFTSIT
jgi:N-acyl-L-homoserine lactone synthetase